MLLTPPVMVLVAPAVIWFVPAALVAWMTLPPVAEFAARVLVPAVEVTRLLPVVAVTVLPVPPVKLFVAFVLRTLPPGPTVN